MMRATPFGAETGKEGMIALLFEPAWASEPAEGGPMRMVSLIRTSARRRYRLAVALAAPTMLQLVHAQALPNSGVASTAESTAQPDYHPSTIPVYRSSNTATLATAFTKAPLDTLEMAIAQRSPAQFTAAYVQLTQACNGCHASQNHAAVVIKAPDAATYPDQDFHLPPR
jgi:hypothetical protein